MDDSKQRKFGAILSYVSIIINCIIQLLYTPLLIRMLGQSEYGLYSLVASIIGYLTVLDFGFGNAIIVYTAKYRAQKKYNEETKLQGMFKLVFIIIGIIAALLGIVLFFLTEKIFGNSMSIFEIKKMKVMMLILSFNLMLTFSFSIYNSIISAYERFTFQKIIAIASSILKPVLMIPLLFLGYKSITMTIVITIVNIIFVFSNYLYCKNKLKIKLKFRGFDKVLFKTILGYSIWIFLSVIVDKVNWSVDQFILGTICGTIAVSIYSVASQINLMFINLSTAISGVFLPKMSKLIAQKSNNEILTNELIRVGRIQFYIVFLVLSGFIIFGKKFIVIWVGEKFIESYYVTLCLICPAIFSLIQNLGLSIMQAMNKFKFKAIITFIMSIFNIFISIGLASKYGAIGAAIGTTISLIICNIIIINIYYYFAMKLNVIKFWKSIAVMFIKLLPIIILTMIVIKNIEIGSIAIFALFIVAYTTIYGITSYIFVMDKYERNLCNSVINRVRRNNNEN